MGDIGKTEEIEIERTPKPEEAPVKEGSPDKTDAPEPVPA